MRALYTQQQGKVPFLHIKCDLDHVLEHKRTRNVSTEFKDVFLGSLFCIAVGLLPYLNNFSHVAGEDLVLNECFLFYFLFRIFPIFSFLYFFLNTPIISILNIPVISIIDIPVITKHQTQDLSLAS